MELWDLYTQDGRPVGETHIRGQQLPPGRYHLVVHCWLRNSRGEFLISRRAANCLTFPLMYECVGGSVVAGEDSLAGALREIQEEVGAILPPQDGTLLRRTVRHQPQDILDIWLFRYDGPIELHNATTDEVADSQWMTIEGIRHLAAEGSLVPSLMYFFEEPGLAETIPKGP